MPASCPSFLEPQLPAILGTCTASCYELQKVGQVSLNCSQPASRSDPKSGAQAAKRGANRTPSISFLCVWNSAHAATSRPPRMLRAAPCGKPGFAASLWPAAAHLKCFRPRPTSNEGVHSVNTCMKDPSIRGGSWHPSCQSQDPSRRCATGATV